MDYSICISYWEPRILDIYQWGRTTVTGSCVHLPYHISLRPCASFALLWPVWGSKWCILSWVQVIILAISQHWTNPLYSGLINPLSVLVTQQEFLFLSFTLAIASIINVFAPNSLLFHYFLFIQVSALMLSLQKCLPWILKKLSLSLCYIFTLIYFPTQYINKLLVYLFRSWLAY